MGLPPRLTRGRSRDVHAWEYVCDVENREDALTLQAESESSGSAIAAISLLRSTSSSGSLGALQPSSSVKRNAPTSRASTRQNPAKKPRLGRAASSVARLQSDHGFDKPSGASLFLSPSGNESDKENWSPDGESNPRYRLQQHALSEAGEDEIIGKPLPAGSCAQLNKSNLRRTPARPLHASRSPSMNSRANTAPLFGRHKERGEKRGQTSLEIFEDAVSATPSRAPATVVKDDEVERFMRGEVSPSKKGDAVAVAGLLSLSQGNWR